MKRIPGLLDRPWIMGIATLQPLGRPPATTADTHGLDMSLGIEMSGKGWLHGPDESDTVGRMTGLDNQLAKDKAC